MIFNPTGGGCGTCRIDFNKRVHVHELENQVVSRPYGVRGSIELTADRITISATRRKPSRSLNLGIVERFRGQDLGRSCCNSTFLSQAWRGGSNREITRPEPLMRLRKRVRVNYITSDRRVVGSSPAGATFKASPLRFAIDIHAARPSGWRNPMKK
jgi:hypothetical protein